MLDEEDEGIDINCPDDRNNDQQIVTGLNYHVNNIVAYFESVSKESDALNFILHQIRNNGGVNMKVQKNFSAEISQNSV